MSVSGCTTDLTDNESGEGSVVLLLTLNQNTITVTKANDAVATTPDISDFKIEIINASGRVLKTWERYADVPQRIRIEAGQYTLKASHGELNDAAFETPYYAGSALFSVTRNGNSSVDLTCALANVKVTVDYKEGFKNYFKNYKVDLSTVGEALHYTKEETRTGYLAPGELSALVTMTKQDDTEITFSPPTSQANGQEYYKFTFDVEQGAGGTNLLVSFDENTAEQPIKIDLDRGWIAHATPFLTPSGFISNQEIKLFEGENHNASLLATARNGIKSCVVTTSSASLLAAGWPATVELVSADETVKTTLRNLGFKWTESLGKLTMGILDFSGVIPYLSCPTESATNHLFTVKVSDQMEQVSQPSILNVTIRKPLFNFLNTEPVFMYAKSAPLTLSMPTGEITAVKLQYIDDWGKWIDCSYTVTSEEDGLYQLEAQKSFTNRPYVFRATDSKFNRTTQTVVGVQLSTFQINPTDAGSIWSHKAYITVEMQQGANNAEVSIEYLTGSEWQPFEAQATTTQENATVYEIRNLASNTSYTIRATYGRTQNSAQSTIRTEEERHIPTFGTWSNTPYSTPKGGRTKAGVFNGWENAPNVTVFAYQVNGWSSVNEKTVPSSPNVLNTWYVIPSTLPTADRNGIADAAVLLRNVAWHNKGTKISDCGSDGAFQGSHVQIPPTAFLYAAGKLFLGSYSVNHATMAETYDEGVAFTSRPATCKGFYKYLPVGADAPYLRVVIENRTGGITTTLAELIIDNLEESQTYRSFEREINYTNTTLSATHLRVMLASSKKQSNQHATENNNGIITTNDTNECNSTGSEFYIDGLSFSY